MKVKAMDLLFDGVPVDCSSQSFAAKAICSIFESEASQLKRVNETHYNFSFLAPKNDTPSLKFKVQRGVINSKDVGRVIQYDGDSQLDAWHEGSCNEIRGTDGTVFPPYLADEDEVWAFSPELCRSIPTTYAGDSKYAGISTARFVMEYPDMANDEQMHCYCRDPNDPGSCPVQGLLDLSMCMQVPVYASNPHFLGVTDEKVLGGVTGLKPIEAAHKLSLDFERVSGRR